MEYPNQSRAPSTVLPSQERVADDGIALGVMVPLPTIPSHFRELDLPVPRAAGQHNAGAISSRRSLRKSRIRPGPGAVEFRTLNMAQETGGATGVADVGGHGGPSDAMGILTSSG